MSFFKHEKALVSPDARIGEGTRVWANANVQAGAVVGAHCNVADGCFIEKGAIVGNHVTLKNNVCLWDGVTLGDDVFVGAGATFINDRFPRSNRKDAWVLEKTIVNKGATIGANATVMCNLTIGEYALVAAGAVVTKDVPAHVIVAGNPARNAGYACQCGRKLNAGLKCSCGAGYKSINQSIERL